MGLFAIDGSETFISAVFTIVPIALATMMEHIGDIAAISATTGKNYIRDPGLNKTPAGRWSCHRHGRPAGRPRQYHLRREHRRSGPDEDLRIPRHPHCCCVCADSELLPEV